MKEDFDPTAGTLAGTRNRATVTTSNRWKVSRGLNQMRSRKKVTSWLAASLALIGLLAGSVVAEAGPRGTTKRHYNKGNQYQLHFRSSIVSRRLARDVLARHVKVI